MSGEKWLFITTIGLLAAIAVSNTLKASRPIFKIAPSITTLSPLSAITEESLTTKYSDDEVMTTAIVTNNTNTSVGYTLTGIPQIDYIWDPNLPRELNGYNLSDYPFYSSMPEDIDFKCDGLHDGFYASVPHKCQVYHHCLFGTRYDFLCANFTAFDQKTFICHFVSEVDCANSKKFWHRNDALYQATTTTTLSPITTSTALAITEKVERVTPNEKTSSIRRRRPFVRRPIYDYYYEYSSDTDYDSTLPRGYNYRDFEEYNEREYRRDRERDFDYRSRDFQERDRKRYSSRANRRDSFRVKDSFEEGQQGSRVEDKQLLQNNTKEHFTKNSDGQVDSETRVHNNKDSSPSINGSNFRTIVRPVVPLLSANVRSRIFSKNRRPAASIEQDKHYSLLSTTMKEELRRRPAKANESDSQRDPTDNIDILREKTPVHNSDGFQERPEVVSDNVENLYDEEIEVRPRLLMRSRPFRDRDILDKRYRERPSRLRYLHDEDSSRRRKHGRVRNRLADRAINQSSNFYQDYLLDYLKDEDAENDSHLERSSDLEMSKKSHSYNMSNVHRGKFEILGTPEKKVFQDIAEYSEKHTPSELSTTEKLMITSSAKLDLGLFDLKEKTKENEKNRFQIHESHRNNKKQEEPVNNHRLKSRKTLNSTTVKSVLMFTKSLEDVSFNNDKTTNFSTEYSDEVRNSTIGSASLLRPRHTIRRPFLPSRGGHPTPRGLLLVGKSALIPMSYDENLMKPLTSQKNTTESSMVANKENEEILLEDRDFKHNFENNKFSSNKKNVQSSIAIPKHQRSQEQDIRTSEQSSIHDVTFNNFERPLKLRKSGVDGDGKIKQTINEVINHYPQDFTEIEYDETLNEALTHNSQSDSTFPSGFILPLYQQFHSYGRPKVTRSLKDNY